MKVDAKKLLPASALGVSLLIHVGLLLMIGGIVLIEGVIPKTIFKGESTYDEAVPVSEEPEAEPPPSDSLSSESLMDQSSTPENNTGAMPDLLSTDISTPTQNFAMSPPAAAISLGNSLSDGGGSKGKGSGTGKLLAPKGKASSIDFFGVKGSARRVAFLLDASGSMVTVQHGGKEGYAKLKADLARMVQALDPETSFSVFIFDSTVDEFRSTDVPATEENKKAFSEWLAPYMTKEFGNILKNYSTTRLNGYRGTTRMDLALTGAFESGCDTIFILTDGTPSVIRPATEKELNEWQRLQERNIKEIEAYNQIQKDYHEKYKVLIGEMQVELRKRNAAIDGRQKEVEYWIEGYKGIPPRPTPKAPPGMWKPEPRVSGEQLIDYLNQLFSEIYQPINQEKPFIHIVGYGVADADRDFLKRMARQFGGNYSDFKF